MKWGIIELKTIMRIFLFLTILITSIRWLTLRSNNSISLRLIILIISICRSIIIGISISSWYGIILFFIYIGGIIVIFSYFIRFNSNNSIWLKRRLQLIILPIIIIKRINITLIIPINKNIQIFKFYRLMNIITSLLIVIILLLMLIIIIKIVKINNAPLRGHQTN